MKRYVYSSLLLLTFLVLPMTVLADPTGGGGVLSTGGGGGSNVPVTVQNPLGSNVNSFCGLVQKLLQASMAVGIPIAVLFIVYAGFKFVLAQGKPEDLKKARQNFLWTLIGIGIFLGAWLLASVLANTVNALGGGQNIISCN